MSPSIDTFTLLTGLLGGLALFLFGLDQLSWALKVVSGDGMRTILARLTRNRLTGVLTGAFITAVVQSSSVTTVLVVGFITAGLMSLSQSIGVIMGANIGSTITAQIIAFKITDYALLLVAAGFALKFGARRERWRRYGQIVMGTGLVFFGMGVMGQAMAPLREQALFAEWMARMERPWLGILAGAVFTAVVQSSAATAGLVIVMAGQGLISLPAGIALVLGANIGTCVTAVLAALGKPREAVRAALVHVLFNVAGVLVWVGFVDRLAELVTWLTPATEGLAGVQRRMAVAPRQIANAHTVFNVVNTVLFVGFATQIARLVERIVPDRPLEQERERARYLDIELLSTPSLALDRARMELLNMGHRVQAMLREILPALLTGTREQLREVGEQDEIVDALHGQIVTYLGRISQTELSEKQTAELIHLMEATNDLENIGDVIETNLVALGHQRLDLGVRISEPTRRVIEQFHATVSRGVHTALHAVTQKNPEAARIVVDMKPQVHRLADSAALHEVQRLVAAEPNRLPAYTVEVDILENLKRVFYFAKRMARVVLSSA